MEKVRKVKKYIKILKKKLGKDKVFYSEEYRYTYSFDASRIESIPDVIVFPEKKEDIIKIVKIASEFSVPVTTRGAGTGQTGGAVPSKKGILISFTKMNKIKKISKKDSIAVVEPGVITYNLQTSVEKKGLFYPPDPASLKTSTIGGNVAENAGGPRCMKYGVTGNYVLGLEAVKMDGEIIHTGSKTIKNVVGYDLNSLLIGSEGTLAIITEIILKLIPKPKKRVVARFGFNNLNKAVEAVTKITTNNFFPSALEFMDKSSIDEVSKYMNIKIPENINSYLLVELDGNPEDIKSELSRLKSLFLKHELEEFLAATNQKEIDQLWEIRRNLSPAITKPEFLKVNEDIVVPRSKLVEIVNYAYNLGKEYNIKTILFGHIGDGNIHTNFLLKPEQEKYIDEILNKFFNKVIDYGGTLSGEHGIGITKRKYINLQLKNNEIILQKKIKKLWDPLLLLNPGKLF